MPGSATTPGHTDTRAVVPICVAFRQQNGVGARNEGLSRLNDWPMHTPADASPAPSQVPAHGSGPMWFATPSSWRTFTAYSLPVSPAHSAVPPIPVITATDRSTYALYQLLTHVLQQAPWSDVQDLGRRPMTRCGRDPDGEGVVAKASDPELALIQALPQTGGYLPRCGK